MATYAIAGLLLALFYCVTALQLEFYPGTQPYHQTGFRFNDTAWMVVTEDPAERYLTYGPYTQEWNTTAASRADF